MSVTIAVDWVPTGEFTGKCWAGEEPVEAFRVEGYPAALDAIAAHKAECVECDAYGIYSSPVADVDLSMNLANSNALSLASVLGIDLGEDLAGSIDAETLLLHLAATPGEGARYVPSTVEKIENGPTVITGQFDAGNYYDRLHEIATEAQRLGREVVWA